MNPEILKATNGQGTPVPVYVDGPQVHDGAVTAKLMLYAIFKRKWQVLAIVAVVVLSILAAGLSRQAMYKTSAKILIRPSRADVQVSAGEQREITLPVSASTEMVNSEMEILRSGDLMRDVIVRMRDAGDPIFGADTDMTMEEQIGGLRRLVAVAPAPQSNVISVDLTARDPERGQRILGVLMQAYLERHAEVHGSTGATAFFEQQKRELRRRLAKAEAKLGNFVEREGLIVPDEQIRWALNETVKYTDVLRTQSNKILALERDLHSFREQVATMPEKVVQFQDKVNATGTQLGSELAKLEAKRATLLQQYRADDRQVRDMDAEIATVKRRMETAASMVGIERYIPNPSRVEMQDKIMKAERNLYDLRARVAALPDFIARQQKESSAAAVELRKKAIRYTSLEQEIVAARETFLLYERKEEEARISEAMDRASLINVSLLDGPSLPSKPANSMSPLMVVAGLIAGTGLGIGTAVGLEFLGRNFKLEEQVEQVLELPVFAVIPDMSETAELQQG